MMVRMFTDAYAFTRRPEILLAGLVVAVLLLIWTGRRLRRAERPDQPLARLAMLIGLLWSSEAVWELTGQIGMPLGVRVALFTVLEVMLGVSMIRAERHVRLHGWAGRAGTTAWTIAFSMSVVAAAVSTSLAEALLRIVIPLLLTKQWWDGLVGDNVQKPAWVTSWRWTPRRVLLALGAIEPGERDVETVHRERLTQQMVRWEFRRRHGNERQRERAVGRLARLSLSADEAIISAVRAQVDRARWFEQDPPAPIPAPPIEPPQPTVVVHVRAPRVNRRGRVRTVRIAHPGTPEPAAQEPFPDDRTAQDLDAVVCALQTAFPGHSQRKIAHLAGVKHSAIRGAIKRIRAAAATHDPAPRPEPVPAPART